MFGNHHVASSSWKLSQLALKGRHCGTPRVSIFELSSMLLFLSLRRLSLSPDNRLYMSLKFSSIYSINSEILILKDHFNLAILVG